MSVKPGQCRFSFYCFNFFKLKKNYLFFLFFCKYIKNNTNTMVAQTHTQHTHTHTHLTALFPGLHGSAGTKKVKTNLDFTEARDSELLWHQLGHMQVCISLQTDNHASNPPLKFFYRLDALPGVQPTASKH